MNRPQAIDLRAQGLNDSPSSACRSKGDRGRTTRNHPEGNMKIRKDAEDDQRHGDNAHGFLGIVGAMAEGEGHGGENLDPVEKMGDLRRRLP